MLKSEQYRFDKRIIEEKVCKAAENMRSLDLPDGETLILSALLDITKALTCLLRLKEMEIKDNEN